MYHAHMYMNLIIAIQQCNGWGKLSIKATENRKIT